MYCRYRIVDIDSYHMIYDHMHMLGYQRNGHPYLEFTYLGSQQEIWAQTIQNLTHSATRLINIMGLGWQVWFGIFLGNFLYPIGAIVSCIRSDIEWSGVRYFVRRGKIERVSNETDDNFHLHASIDGSHFLCDTSSWRWYGLIHCSRCNSCEVGVYTIMVLLSPRWCIWAFGVVPSISRIVRVCDAIDREI